MRPSLTNRRGPLRAVSSLKAASWQLQGTCMSAGKLTTGQDLEMLRMRRMTSLDLGAPFRNLPCPAVHCPAVVADMIMVSSVTTGMGAASVPVSHGTLVQTRTGASSHRASRLLRQMLLTWPGSSCGRGMVVTLKWNLPENAL